jgi:type I restriction enzyme S subunit
VNEFERYPAMRPSGLNWIDELPSHWAERRGKFLFSLKQRPVRPVDGVVTAFRDGQVTLRTNRRTDGFTNSLKEIGYQGVREGDLVIHAMDGFAGAIGVSDSDGKCSPVYSCCTQRKNSDAYFYAYLLRNMAATGFIESLAKGIRERSTDFRWKDFSELSLPLPPVEEQRTIAKKLDRETARIDALIEKKTRFIELLKEKRQALITQAVTKGLDPTVPMKDSGVEWIGEVPAHWRLTKLAHISEKVGDGLHGTPSYEDNTKIFFINGNNLADGCIRITEKTKEVSTKSHRAYFIPMDDRTVLLSINGTIGNVARYNDEQIVLGKSAAYIACSEKLVPEFLMLSFESGAAKSYFDLEVTGTTIFNLSLQSIREFKICLPDLAEQEKIIATVNAQKKQIDALIGAVSKSIDLLKERRSALITAAVTGQIDLREEE